MISLVILFSLAASCIANPLLPTGSSSRLAPDTIRSVNSNSKAVEDYLLPRSVFPINYDVFLATYLEVAPSSDKEFTFDGTVTITIVAAHETKTIQMHAYDLTVSQENVRVYSQEGEEFTIASFSMSDASDDRQFLTITLEDSLMLGGTYFVEIIYSGKLNDDLDGYYRSKYTGEDGVTKWLATTQFEAAGARRAFPCWDEPWFKAKFNISIAHAPQYHALSNMPVEYVDDYAEMAGWKKTIFYVSEEVMSSYLVAFVVSEFKNITHEEFDTYKSFARPGLEQYAKFGNDLAPKFIKHMEDYTGHAYSFPKMDQIAIPDFAAGAMENWGLVTYRETALLYSDVVSSTSSKWGVASIVAHELAHQWFGNIVSPTWWSHIWLNEGFATYYSYYILSQEFPDWEQLESLPQVEMHSVFKTDALDTSHPLLVDADSPAASNAVFDDIAYNKGSCIVRMMIHMIPNDGFKQGINAYLTDREFNNADKNDLWRNLQTVIKDGDLPDTVATIMDTWTVQAGFPVVHVTRDYSGNKINMTQERFFALRNQSVVNNQLWYIPITMNSAKTPDFNDLSVDLWLNTKEKIVSDGVPASTEWLLVNVQQAGYYRVHYDDKNWELLTAAIKVNVSSIHFVNRAQILDDSLALARAKYLNYQLALETTDYLAEEQKYIPYSAALSGMSYIKDRLSYEESSRLPLETYMTQRLNETYYWLGGFTIGQNDNDVTKRMRSMIVSGACGYGLEKCNADADVLFAQWVATPEQNPIAPDLKSTVYCAGMRTGGQAEYDFLFDRYENSANLPGEQSTIISALGCASDKNLLQMYLDESIAADSRIRTQDARSVLSAVQNNYLGVDLALDFIIGNYERCSEVYGGLGAMGRVFSSLSNKLNTNTHRQKLVAFRDSNDLGTVENDITGAIEKLDEILDWHSAHKSSVVSYFRRKNSAGLAVAAPLLALLSIVFAIMKM